MTAPRRVLPYGPQSLLAEYDTLADVVAAAAALRAAAPPDVVDIVPAARTILVTTTGDLAAAERALRETSPTLRERDTVPPLVALRVRYDGEDLADVALACGLGVGEVVELHTAATYTVAFCGFMPGFSYLTGLDARLHLPRRTSPRPRVPPGSVAIASEFTAVYPSASPGGWHLLGSTDAVMWAESRPLPALLPPGTEVRFVAT